LKLCKARDNKAVIYCATDQWQILHVEIRRNDESSRGIKFAEGNRNANGGFFSAFTLSHDDSTTNGGVATDVNP
jgi:hypothetical protein